MSTYRRGMGQLRTQSASDTGVSGGDEKEGEMILFGTMSRNRRSPGRIRPWRTPSHLAVLFALFMALGSLISTTSADVLAAPQSGAADLAGQFQATGTSSLQVDVVRCPDGFDPNDLFGDCHNAGILAVGVQIASVDPTLGIDQTVFT
ncbi:MAG: hypothetical protein ACR2GI_07820, partial [Thermomicrobiales bacterium]